MIKEAKRKAIKIKRNRLPTLEEINKAISYDPLTGIATYNDKYDSLGRFRKGGGSGFKTDRGYVKVYISGKGYCVHRIAYKKYHGAEPDFIDHANGNTSDNRLSNLRECTSSQNNSNAKKWRKKDLPKGVRKHSLSYLSGAKYEARIVVNKKHIYLGVYTTPELAHNAYMSAALKYHGQFAKFN